MKTQEIIQMSDEYVMQTYGRIHLAPVRGSGARLWDAEGNEYLDFLAGIAVNSLGHCHPAVVQAVQDQAARLMHVSNLYYIEPQAKLARLLVENSCCQRVFFCNSGAEANEGAIKLARRYAKLKYGPERYKIITAEKSFHGRTLATVTATGQSKYQQGFEPLPAGFDYVPYNDLAALEQKAGSDTCAVMLEVVQGEGGVNVPDPEYLVGVQKLCRELGILLILDEVQTGLGRTGKFLAYEHYGLEPDIFTLAKSLGGGFPIGATLAQEEVAAAFSPGMHASTFGGNPLACAAGLAAMETLLSGVLDNCVQVGGYFREKLAALQRSYPLIKEVRGMGLLLGVELTAPGGVIVDNCRKKGLLLSCVNENVLRFAPPLIITREDVDQALTILEDVLTRQ